MESLAGCIYLIAFTTRLTILSATKVNPSGLFLEFNTIFKDMRGADEEKYHTEKDDKQESVKETRV